MCVPMCMLYTHTYRILFVTAALDSVTYPGRVCGRGLVLALCGRGFMLAPRVGVALCFRCVVLGALDSSRAGGAPWNYCQNAVFCRSYLTGFTVCEKGLEQRLFWDAAWTPQARSWPLALRRCSCARYLLPPIPA